MRQRILLPVFAFLVVAAPALAEELGSRALAYPNEAGIQLSIEAEGGPAAQPSQRLNEAIARMENSLGSALPGDAPQIGMMGGHTFAAIFRRFQKDPNMVHVLLTTDADVAICHVAGPMTPQLQAALPPALQACSGELSRQVAAASAQPPSDVGKAPPLASPKFADNWSQVEGVFFRGTSRFGIGGMIVLDYRPVILFKDGTSYEVGDAALEDVDLAAERAAKPQEFGRWSQSGDAYSLTGTDGKAHSYELQGGSFFKAFPADRGGALSARYKRISGGGNTALGGETMIATSNQYAFTAGGQFRIEGGVGASISGDQSGVSTTLQSETGMAAPGHYALDNHTLTLIYPDGRQERRFFAFASRKNPAVLDPGMIFMDDSSYTSED